MDILDFTRDDLRRIRHLQPEGWTDIGPEFENYLRKPFCFPIKVIIGNQIAGTGAAMMTIPAALEGYRPNRPGPLSRIDSSGNITTDSTIIIFY